jgi:hypothetical protein
MRATGRERQKNNNENLRFLRDRHSYVGQVCLLVVGLESLDSLQSESEK